MTTRTSQPITDHLEWRYAVDRFDPHSTIDDQTWDHLERTLVLTPSSYGLQPWRFVVVRDRATRERLVPHAWGQRQIADCSHLVVMCRKTEVTEADVDAYIERCATVRGQSEGAYADFRRGVLRTLAAPASLPGGSVEAWTRSQVYIALGVFLAAAAAIGVDTCPMEGFAPAAFDRELGLSGSGYTSVVLAACGYRSEADPTASLAKVRFEHHRVIRRI